MAFRSALARLLTVATLGTGLAGSLASFALGMTPGANPVETTGAVSRLPYVEPGGHSVGLTHSNTAEGIRLDIWYPSSNTEISAITYTYALTFGELQAAIATYEGTASRTALPAQSGPFPLVVLSPGFAIGSGSYAWLAEHLASHGFVVAAIDHQETLDPGQLWRSTITRPRDLESAVLHLASAQSGIFEIIDADRVAVVGHSYGGYTALAAAGARIDTLSMWESCGTARLENDPVVFQCDALLPHVEDMSVLAGFETVSTGPWPALVESPVDAVVALAPDAIMFGEAGLRHVTAPLLVIGGTADTDSPFRWGAELAYDGVGSPRKVEVAVEGAEHLIFAGPCERVRRVLELVPTGLCSDPAWSRSEAHALTRSMATTFLLAELEGDESAGAYLDSALEIGNAAVRTKGYR